MIIGFRLQSLFALILIILLSACHPNEHNAFQRLSAIPDTLLIDNTRDTLVFGRKGTVLFFQGGSFELPDGSAVKGKVSILLKECYSLSSIIGENLSTTAGDRFLETRGMINIKAFSGDQELILKRGRKFIIHFPKDSVDRKKQMNLFYGDTGNKGNIDWKLDSTTLLRPTAFMTGWSTFGWPAGDSAKEAGFYFKGTNGQGIYDYFYEHFDNSKLQQSNNLTNRTLEARFIVTKEGKIKNVKIKETLYDSSGKEIRSNSRPDPYFYEYIRNLPDLEPYYFNNGAKLEPFDSQCSFWINMGLYPPDYRKNEVYNKLFNQKYSAFRNRTIQSMNDAELNYYVFSSSKLGWINCDFFWETRETKIDYIVKAGIGEKPNIRLIFKQAKVIIAGTFEGDKFIFRNIPGNQDVKIVAIAYNGSKPLMAIAETKIGRQPFDKLEYKEFTIADLEKQLNTP